jgi:ribosome biogenesis GTPase / thiamine phosphate phosphatase
MVNVSQIFIPSYPYILLTIRSPCTIFVVMKARIYKSTGSWYLAKALDGKFYQARARGIFKIDGITSTNPIAVGDEVELVIEDVQEESAVIDHIYDRTNYVARVSPHNKHQHHIIASNLDQSILLATLVSPKTSMGFIDRFLVSSASFHIPAILVFNKSDLYRKKEMDQLNRYREIYEAIGYEVLLISVLNNSGLDTIRERIQHKTTLLSGHSGVGKSSFINSLFPDFQLPTSEVSEWSGKGLHTTTFAEMFDLPGGGSIIDTPGLREFGLVDISRQELSHYFPEMLQQFHHCRFNNCMHINEAECGVKAGLAFGTVSEERYLSYRAILDTISDKQY